MNTCSVCMCYTCGVCVYMYGGIFVVCVWYVCVCVYVWYVCMYLKMQKGTYAAF